MSSSLDLAVILRVVDHLSAPLNALNARLEALHGPVRRLGSALNNSLRLTGVSQITRGLSQVGTEMGALTLKLAMMGGAAGLAFKTMFIDVAAEYENLAVALEASEGSAEKGKKAMAWITDFAKRTPLELNTTTRAYTMLKNSGIDPMNGSLMALVDANARLNGSQEDMIGITQQITQAWMLGKLQMEDSRILMQRGIPVIDLMAKALHKNSEQIMEMMHKGQLGRKEMILLFKGIAASSKGAAEKQSRTWTGMISTLTDTWKGFVNQLMNSGGAFEFLKGKLDAVINKLAFLQTPEGLKEVDAYGKQLYETLVKIADTAEQAWAGINDLAVKVGGFGNLAKLVFGGVAAIMAGPLLLAIAMVGEGVLVLSGALLALALANPLLVAIEAVVVGIWLLANNWEAVSTFFKEQINSIKDSLVNNLMAAINYVVDGIKLAFAGITDGVAGVIRAIKNIATLKNPFSGGEPLFSMPTTGSHTQPLATAPALATLAKQAAGKTDIGGVLSIKIDSDVPVKVQRLRNNSPLMNYNVDAGLTMPGAR